jgi:PAS domain S-box-containing protein
MKKQLITEEAAKALSHFTVEKAFVAVVWTDAEGNIYRVNEAVCRITGYSAPELLRLGVKNLGTEYEKYGGSREEWAQFSKDKYSQFETFIRRKDGSIFPAEIFANHLVLDGAEYGCICIIDITERKEAESELKAALTEVKTLKERLAEENAYLIEEIKAEHNFSEIIGSSKPLQDTLVRVERVAETDSTVLIRGETGTGKELIARAIHDLSSRSDRPLVKVNCAALPAGLMESELFGHEKGAYTGATARREGRFELAHRGTLFLDEVGDLPMDLQTKLLRVLQEGEFERLGGMETKKVDVRVVAATNRDLEELIGNGQFRQDLYYRLNVFPIDCPPLRERKGDIPLIVKHFVEKFSAKIGKPIDQVPQRVMDALINYRWPGNVRELQNIVERAVILSTGTQLQLEPGFGKGQDFQGLANIDTLEEHERNYIIHVLENTGGRVSGESGAAKLLGLKDQTLFSKMRRLGIKTNNH